MMIAVSNYNPYHHSNLENLIKIYKYVLEYGYTIRLKTRTSMPTIGRLEYWFELEESGPFGAGAGAGVAHAFLRVDI